MKPEPGWYALTVSDASARRFRLIGPGLGGILVILIALFFSVVLGLIITVVGPAAFGGFAKGRRY